MAIVGIGAAASGVGSPGGGFTVEYTQPAGLNRVALVSTAFEGTVDITGIDYNGVAMVLIATSTQGTLVSQMWGLLEASLPADGTFDLTVQGSTSGNTASITCGMHSGVTQAYLPPPTVGGDTSANVNHDISIFAHAVNDFVFWGMAKNEGTAYASAECPLGSAALQINTNFPTGVTHRVNRSQNAVGVARANVVARCVDDDAATAFAGVAVLMREAFTTGPDPTVISSGGPFVATTIENLTALQDLDLAGSSNRLGLCFIQTTGNERIASVTLGVEPATLISDGTINGEDIIDSGTEDLVHAVFAVKEADFPGGASSSVWIVTLTGAQPSIVQSVILRDAAQGDLAGISIASQGTASNPLVDFGGALVDFPGSLAFASIGSVQ